MAALWRNFQRFSVANPCPPVPETWVQIESLEGEVTRLNKLLKSQGKEISARDQSLVEEKRLKEKYKEEAREADARYVQVVATLAEEQDLQDNLEVELGAYRTYASTLSMKLSASKVAKEKAKSEKEAAVAEKLKSEEHTKSWYKRLQQKYNHYKNKSKCLLGQLAFVPKLRDFCWGWCYSWGFENYRTLELNPEIYTYDKAIVCPFLVGIPEEAIKEVEELGKNFFS
jgi:hypothetical protein